MEDNQQDQDPQEAPQAELAAVQDLNPARLAAAMTALITLQYDRRALIPQAQYASRLRQCCAFFGCSYLAPEGSRYCSPFHAEISDSLGNGDLAYVVVDGSFEKVKELDMKSMLALLNKSEGINVGVPTIRDESVFETAPWELGFINMALLQQETKREWVFFYPKTRPTFRNFEYHSRVLAWARKTNNRHRYGNHPFTSSVSYLQFVSGDGDTAVLQAMVKAWTLHEHVFNGQSIFCLCLSLDVPPELCERMKGKTDSSVKQKESDSKRDNTASSSKPKPSDSKTGSASKRKASGDRMASASKRKRSVNQKLVYRPGDGQVDLEAFSRESMEQGVCPDACEMVDTKLPVATEEECDGDGQINEALSKESMEEGICSDAYEKMETEHKLSTKQEEANSGSEKMLLGQCLKTTM